MARHLEKLPDGSYRETITDATQCRWMYDDVCCNKHCNMVAYMPTPTEYCTSCKYYTKEISNAGKAQA